MLESKGVKIPIDFDVYQLRQIHGEMRKEPRTRNYNDHDNTNDNNSLTTLTQQM